MILYTCTECSETKEENYRRADHSPDEVGRCVYCYSPIGNPNTAIYTFTADDGTYYEFFEDGQGYMYLPYFEEDNRQWVMRWRTKDGAIEVLLGGYSYDSTFVIDADGNLEQTDKVDRTN